VQTHFVRSNLAVCGFLGIGSREEFSARGFHAQLQCAEPFDAWLPECVEVMSLPFDDAARIPEGTFRRAQDWLGAHWDLGHKILISCAGGQSRSVTMAITLLHAKGRLRFIDAIRDVMDRIPGSYPHPHVLASAARFCGEPLKLEDLQAAYAAVPVQPPYPWSVELLSEAVRL
jgi:hypothetical protein